MISKFTLGFLFLPVFICVAFVVCALISKVNSIIIPYIFLMFLVGLILFGVWQVTVSWKTNKAFSAGLITGFVPTIFALYVFGTIFLTQRDSPNGDLIVQKLNEYKKSRGSYPNDLSLFGLKKYEADGRIVYNYYPEDNRFWLCNIFYTPVGSEGSCYDSRIKKWETR